MCGTERAMVLPVVDASADKGRVSYAITLRACYAMSSTDLAYGSTRLLRDVRAGFCPPPPRRPECVVLRTRYKMSGAMFSTERQGQYGIFSTGSRCVLRMRARYRNMLPLYILNINVNPRPYVVDQVFRYGPTV
eukprot:2016384-Rhodomonas_salina.1